MPTQVARDGMRAGDDMRVIAFAIGCVAAVRYINEVLMGQLCAQRAQHAQTSQATVKYANGVGCSQSQDSA